MTKPIKRPPARAADKGNAPVHLDADDLLLGQDEGDEVSDFTDEELGLNPLKIGKFDPLKKRRFLDQLRSGLSRSQAARAVGVTLRTVEKHQAKFPAFREAITLAEMEAAGAIENALYVAAKSGNVIAIQVYLYNRVPERWSDRRGSLKLEGRVETVVTTPLSDAALRAAAQAAYRAEYENRTGREPPDFPD